MSAEFDLEQARSVLTSGDEEDRRRLIAEIPLGWTAGALALLVDALGDVSWRVRKDAIMRVARWPDPEGAVTRLIAALADDSNVGLRNAAVEALAAIGRPSVAPLVTALEGGSDFKKFIIEGLAAIGDRAAVPALARALEDADENVRAAAAEALGQLGGAEAEQALRRRLPQSDLLGRLAVLEALNRIGARLPLAEVHQLAQSPILRRAALEAVGHSGDLAGLALLCAGLADKLRGTRESAALGLSALHAGAGEQDRRRIEDEVRKLMPGAVVALMPSVAADSVPVRRAVVQLLGWGRWPEALPRLTDALRDEDIHATTVKAIVAFGDAARAPLTDLAKDADSELRGELFALLARLPGAETDAQLAALLVEALDDDDPVPAAAAALALGEVGGRAALAPLYHALERRAGGEVAHAAAQALARLGKHHPDEARMLVTAHGLERGETGVLLCRVLAAVGRAEDRPLLLRALSSDDQQLRRAAAEAVPSLGQSPDAREALVFALADEEPSVRAGAAEALGALGDGEAVTALTGALGDEDETVRLAAVRALGALGDPRAGKPLRTLAGSGDAGIAVYALEALGRLTSSDDAAADEKLFASALGRPDPEVVKAAVRALSGRTGDAAAAGLTQALGHQRWDVRRLAAQALASRAAKEPAARKALEARASVETDPLVREVIDAAVASR